METPKQQKPQRIEYVDLMKGICITLVVIFHCGIYPNNHFGEMLTTLRMPTFIFLAGTFLSFSKGVKATIVKKVNRYILPIIFFNLLYIIVTIVTHPLNSILKIKIYLYPGVVYLDPDRFNSALWFLRYLFFSCLIVAFIERILRSQPKAVKSLVVIAISAATFYIYRHFDIGNSHVYVLQIMKNLCIFTAIVFLPLYYIPYLLREQILMAHSKHKLLIGLPFAIIIWYFTAHLTNTFKFQTEANYLEVLLSSFSAVYCCYCCAYFVKRIPFISYLGRYSIIILCTSDIVIYLASYTAGLPNWGRLIVTIVTAPLIIYVCRRYIPHFCAQKDLLKIDENGKIKFSLKD